jgi:hypothetical protein
VHCGIAARWGGHGSYTRHPYLMLGVRATVQVPRFACGDCKKTISAPDKRLQKRRQYCLDALLPLVLVYLLQAKSYEHCVWYPLNPSTLWRWMNWLCHTSRDRLMILQRGLVEASVPLMAQATASTECANASKARLSIMRDGLNDLKAIVELAGQFLAEGALAQVTLPKDAYQRYSPQSSQYTLF